MNISEVRKNLTALVEDLPIGGIKIEKHGKVVAILAPFGEGPEWDNKYQINVPVNEAFLSAQEAAIGIYTHLAKQGIGDLETVQRADKARLELLNKINRKSK